MKLKGGFSAGGGTIVGRTGDTEYFFFTCPKCPDEQIMRVLDYEFRDDAQAVVRDERGTRKNISISYSRCIARIASSRTSSNLTTIIRRGR